MISMQPRSAILHRRILTMAICGAIVLCLAGPQLAPADAQEADDWKDTPWRVFDPAVGYVERGRNVRLTLPDEQAYLERLPELHKFAALRLHLTGAGVTDDVLERIVELNNVQALMLHNTTITDKGLELLKRLPRLREIEVHGAPASGRCLKHLAAHRELRVLAVSGVEFEAKHLEPLAALTELRFLFLSDLHDNALRHLSELSNLETLMLFKSPITNAGLAHLAGLSNLRHLHVMGTRITDDGLVHLQTLTSLESLRVTTEVDLGAAGLVHLKPLKNLRMVHGVDAGLVTELPWLAQQAVMQVLEDETHLEMLDVAVEEVREFLSDLHDTTVTLDPDAMGTWPDVAITLDARNVTLRTALDLLCESHDLAWFAQADQLLLTTRQALKRKAEQRTYDVGPMIGRRAEAAAEVADGVVKLIDPDSWAMAGGDSRKKITREGTRLTIAQSPVAHRKIDQFLQELGDRGRRPDLHVEKIRHTLDEPTSIDVDSAPLVELLTFLADIHDIPFHIDRPGLKRHDISVNAPVRLEVDNVPLRDALNQLLEPLKLTGSIRYQSYYIEPQADVTSGLEARAYHIGDLLTEERTPADIARLVRARFALPKKPGRLCLTCANRLAIRATAGEHERIAAFLQTQHP